MILRFDRITGLAAPKLHGQNAHVGPIPSNFLAFQRKRTEAIGVKAPLPGFVEPASASSIAKVKIGSDCEPIYGPAGSRRRVCHCAFHVVRYRDLPEALLVPVVD